jgi:hypothetical protein
MGYNINNDLMDLFRKAKIKEEQVFNVMLSNLVLKIEAKKVMVSSMVIYTILQIIHLI